MKRPLLLLLLSVLLSGFLRSAGDGADVVYAVRGTLTHLDPAANQATIAHEAIPGYMEAMTMEFDLRELAAWKNFHEGDVIDFQLTVRDQQAWIEAPKLVRPAAFPLLEAPSAAATPGDLALKPGDPMPDVTLLDQTGHAVRLRDFRGQAVALTFIYTRCPLPTYCPLMSRNFATAQSLLDRMGLAERCHFLSVSFDAAHDRPGVLADYAKTWAANPAHWTFAAADASALRPLGAGVGLEFREQDGQLVHNLRTVVIDRAGHLRKIFSGNRWTPQELAAEVQAALRAKS